MDDRFFVVSAIFLALGDGFASKAAGTVIYNADDFESFKGRTKEEIGKRYSEAMYMGQTYENDESESYYKKTCSLTAPEPSQTNIFVLQSNIEQSDAAQVGQIQT